MARDEEAVRCCGNTETTETPGKMGYRRKPCRRRFPVRTGAVLERSNIPLRKWAMDRVVHAPPHPRGMGKRLRCRELVN